MLRIGKNMYKYEVYLYVTRGIAQSKLDDSRQQKQQQTNN